ncbi:MAG: DALR anticodon-binding domain-containing protein, partial [Patescibacteria group bacterium]|nr:DALR anticodon-binding domain-containing protein [Patescibacteria group bacterium]
KIQKFYEADEKLVERKKEVLKLIEEGNNETSQKASEIANKVINRHLKTFSRLNVAYDLLVWERDIIDVGLWPSVFEKLKTEKLIENPTYGDYKDTWLVRFGFDTRDDKILVKSDGTATYTAKDLAYEMWKFSLLDIDFPYFTRGTQYNKQPLTTTKGGIQEKSEDTTRNIPKPVKVFTLIDERQEYPRQVIKYTLEQLGYKDEAKNSIHVGYGVVRLSRNALEDLGITPKEKKESYAMSGRSGIGVKIDDLMDKTEEKIAEINPELSEEDVKTLSNATIRYYMLRNRINKEAIFDFAEALKTDGNTGVYLEYAYARCCNILNKINALPSFDDITPPQDLDQTNKNLISLLENYPSQIEKSSQVCDPSLLTDYAFSIASAFAKFYETNPVLKAQSIELKIFRIQMVAATKEVLGNILNLLGISPLTKI